MSRTSDAWASCRSPSVLSWRGYVTAGAPQSHANTAVSPAGARNRFADSLAQTVDRLERAQGENSRHDDDCQPGQHDLSCAYCHGGDQQ